MTATRADMALAEARMLIEDRAAWPAAPLIGAGATWLRPGTIAGMAGELADSEEATAAFRAAVRPMGVLDALAILEQHDAFVAARVADLERLGQTDAAMTLQAEAAMPEDRAWHKRRGQFEALAAARVEAERPDVPAWIDGMGGAGWTPIAVAERWGASDEALDELGPVRLDERLAEIELAQRQTAARIAWLRKYQYPLPAGDADGGLLSRASNAAATLAKVHGEATAALGRSEIPESWTAGEITRRMANRLAMRAPALFAEMMTRASPPRVIDSPGGPGMTPLPHAPADLTAADAALAAMPADPSAMTAALAPVREAIGRQAERTAAAAAILEERPARARGGRARPSSRDRGPGAPQAGAVGPSGDNRRRPRAPAPGPRGPRGGRAPGRAQPPARRRGWARRSGPRSRAPRGARPRPRCRRPLAWACLAELGRMPAWTKPTCTWPACRPLATLPASARPSSPPRRTNKPGALAPRPPLASPARRSHARRLRPALACGRGPGARARRRSAGPCRARCADRGAAAALVASPRRHCCGRPNRLTEATRARNGRAISEAPMSRTTKLTEERQAAILAALEDGATWEAAAAAAGVHRATLHRWRERGGAAKQGKFRDFCDAATRAIARGEARAARQLVAGFTLPTTETIVEEAADGSKKTRTVTRPPDAGLALKWLERRCAAQWGARQRLAIGGDPDAPPVRLEAALAEIDVADLPDDALAHLDEFLRLVTKGGSTNDGTG